MKVEDRHGIVLDFSEPINSYELIKVTHCRPGKAPEFIGGIERVIDEKTDTVYYRAFNQYREPLGRVTTDWQEVELNFQKHAYDNSRNQAHQAFVRMMGRAKELHDIRKGKGQAIGRERDI